MSGPPVAAPCSRFAHPHADVLGVQVSAINMTTALFLANEWIAAGNPGYICFTAVHGVMEAQSHPDHRRILNEAVINAPDGMPMTWVGWLQGLRAMDRVYGPDFMAAMCRLSVERGYRNYFYGGQPGVAALLSEALQKKFPGLLIAGARTPPFRSLTREEEEQLVAEVRACRPHIFWVGLGAPKQERFMAEYFERLQVPLLAGVGAAFDYHTGRLCESPQWLKRAGLQWLHRLMQEPRRLWRRYLRTNPAFLWRVILSLADRPLSRNAGKGHRNRFRV